MLGAEAERAVELGRPARFVVAGERVDEVEADAVDRALRGGERALALVGGVGAAEEGEAGVVEALQAEADAVDPGAGEVGEVGGLGAVGVGLERDLDVVGGAPMVSRGGDDGFDGGRRHQRRGAAAEEDRGQAVVGEERRFMRQVGEQGVAPRVLVDASRTWLLKSQ